MRSTDAGTSRLGCGTRVAVVTTASSCADTLVQIAASTAAKSLLMFARLSRMPPRGNRLACTLRSVDGAQGTFDAYAGEQPGSISRVDPVKWNKRTDKPVLEGAFTVIG